MSGEPSKKIQHDRYATAIHEAAHAVIYSIALGHDVYFVTMCNDDGDGMSSHGSGPVEDEVLSAWAGQHAQSLFSSSAPTWSECSQDLSLIDQMLGIWRPYPLIAQVLLREELRLQSLRLVIAREKEIRLVADHLLKWGEIGRKDGSGLFASDIIKNILDPSHFGPPES